MLLKSRNVLLLEVEDSGHPMTGQNILLALGVLLSELSPTSGRGEGTLSAECCPPSLDADKPDGDAAGIADADPLFLQVGGFAEDPSCSIGIEERGVFISQE